MHSGTPARILVVDDIEAQLRQLLDVLAAQGYRVSSASSGAQALQRIEAEPPDLLLLDVSLPGLSGPQLCRLLRGQPRHAMLPIVLIMADDPDSAHLGDLDAGADDFLSRPFGQAELLARVRSLLRIKALYDEVQRQRSQLDSWNHALQQRVAAGVEQLERLSRLKRFVAPALAEAIIQGGSTNPLRSHRREIVMVCLELRGYTALTEAVEPEILMGLLREYHAAMGALIQASDGTLERFSGDGITVVFNDPVPTPDAAERALRMALQMQRAMHRLAADWRQRGHQLQLGIGVAQGLATLGAIGFEGRLDYAAVGSVSNLAHRLCAEARGGEILAAPELLDGLAGRYQVEPIGPLTLRGHAVPVMALQVLEGINAAPAPTPAAPVSHQHGRIELRPAQRQLLVDGQPLAIGARAFDLLLVLVEQQARVVSKAELLERVWPGLIVEENNLQVQISTLRKLLGADAIATIPGRGYRFTLAPTAAGRSGWPPLDPVPWHATGSPPGPG